MSLLHLALFFSKKRQHELIILLFEFILNCVKIFDQSESKKKLKTVSKWKEKVIVHLL